VAENVGRRGARAAAHGQQRPSASVGKSIARKGLGRRGQRGCGLAPQPQP
jgi:hypothetical protein